MIIMINVIVNTIIPCLQIMQIPPITTNYSVKDGNYLHSFYKFFCLHSMQKPPLDAKLHSIGLIATFNSKQLTRDLRYC